MNLLWLHVPWNNQLKKTFFFLARDLHCFHYINYDTKLHFQKKTSKNSKKLSRQNFLPKFCQKWFEKELNAHLEWIISFRLKVIVVACYIGITYMVSRPSYWVTRMVRKLKEEAGKYMRNWMVKFRRCTRRNDRHRWIIVGQGVLIWRNITENI